MTKSLNIKKRRAQRGRPPKEGVGRAPSGAISRAQENVMGVVIDSRIRHGVKPEEAPRQEGGTALGRLWGVKLITTAQKDAGEAYAELWALADRYVTGRPHGFERVTSRPGVDWELMEQADREEYAERSTAVIGKRAGLRAMLTESKAEATVHWVCILDCDPPDWMLPDLRDGLTLLAGNFKTGA